MPLVWRRSRWAPVDSFSAVGAGVALSRLNGSMVDGDMLVGADGVQSIVRRQLHPDQPPPRHSRIVAVRGSVHGVLQHLGDLHAVYYLGPGVESALVRASDTGIYWFLSLAKCIAPPGTQDPAALVAAMAPKFDDTFRAITSATEDMRYNELIDRDSFRSWGRGAVTLLGDAAHPLLPHTGQGAAQAIVDAVTLGKAVRNSTNLEKSLREYERERIPKTARLLGQGRRTARVMATSNPVACYVRELVVRAIPVTTVARILVRINRRAGTAANH